MQSLRTQRWVQCDTSHQDAHNPVGTHEKPCNECAESWDGCMRVKMEGAWVVLHGSSKDSASLLPPLSHLSKLSLCWITLWCTPLCWINKIRYRHPQWGNNEGTRRSPQIGSNYAAMWFKVLNGTLISINCNRVVFSWVKIVGFS